MRCNRPMRQIRSFVLFELAEELIENRNAFRIGIDEIHLTAFNFRDEMVSQIESCNESVKPNIKQLFSVVREREYTLINQI